MTIEGLRIIVVGGGTGGAAAALLCARAGTRVTLIEKVAEPRAVGAGLAIAENGLAVLESLGLKPALATAASSLSGLRIVDGRGRTIFAPPPPVPSVWMMRRSDLQMVLLDALAAEPLVETRFGADVVEATPDGSVTIRTSGGEARVAGDLVVAADGVHSRIRARGPFQATVTPPGITYIRALVRPALAQNVEAWTAAGLFGSFSVPDGTYVYASLGSPACRAAQGASDLMGLRAAWAEAYAPAGEILGAVARWEDLVVTRVQRVTCRRWFNGRVVLLGDAAHAMAPNLGQGANSALVDAAVLLDEMRRAPDTAEALARYQARRAPAVRRVAVAAARLGAIAELTHPLARAARDRVLMPLAARIARASNADLVLQESTTTLRAIGRA